MPRATTKLPVKIIYKNKINILTSSMCHAKLHGVKKMLVEWEVDETWVSSPRLYTTHQAQFSEILDSDIQ